MMQDQRLGVVEQDFGRHAAEVAECRLQPVQPGALALMPERRHEPAPRVSERRHEQTDPHHLAADRDRGRAEVDLQLPARRRLETHARPRLGHQLAPKSANRPLHRAQADADAMLPLQLLTDDVGVATVPAKPLGQPVFPSVQRSRSPGASIRRPATLAQIAPNRVPAAAELERDPLRPPTQLRKPQHHRHILGRLHPLFPRSPRRGKSIAHSRHLPSAQEGSVFVSPGGQFHLSADTLRSDLQAARTGFATLDRLLARLHANKPELLIVLDRPESPLHTNGSENDIRCHVTKRKVSGGTRSDAGRDCRDAFLGLAQDLRQARHRVPSGKWLEFEGGVISGLFNQPGPALSRRRRSRHDDG